LPAGDTFLAVRNLNPGSAASPTSDPTADYSCTNTVTTPNPNFWSMARGGLTFASPGLPAYAVITAATINGYSSLYSKIIEQGWWSSPLTDIVITAFSPANPISFAVGDFALFGSTAFSTKLLNDITEGGNQAIAFGLNASGIAAIALNTYTSFMMRTGADVATSAPAWVNGGGYTVSLQKDTATLDITYTYKDDAGFRYRKAGATYKVCTTSTDPGSPRMAIRKGGATYYMPLVATDRVDASSFRVRIGGETKAGILVL